MIRALASLLAAIGGGWLMLLAIRSVDQVTFYVIAMATAGLLSAVIVWRILARLRKSDDDDSLMPINDDV